MDLHASPPTVTEIVHADSHPLVSLISACFWVILWLLSWAKSLVAFATISVPRLLYSILSYSLTLTLNFWSFAIMFSLFAVALNYWIRFHYLNDYTQLKEVPLGKPDATELHPDANTDPPPTFHNYLDDFLQAVRVFGFLEKPVFHELARHLQTRRLIAGDSIYLDQDKSFYCVVDGMVQVYARTGPETTETRGSWDDEDMNGYQLLNEVGSGGTLSSLFTILSLFTEDVKMSWQDGTPGSPNPEPRSRTANSDIPAFDLSHSRRPSYQRNLSMSSMASSIVTETGNTTPERGRVRSFLGDDGSNYVPVSKESSIHHGTVARATEDTTLAVIPAEAFKRLVKKYPKATGHIVQVILTRFSRVTFHAAHKYLGLTKEVLRTEKAINEMASHPLPASFYEGGGLEFLRQRFDQTGDSDAETEDAAFTHLTEGSSSTVTAEPEGYDHPKVPETPKPTHMSPSNSLPPGLTRGHSRTSVQAGDLLSSLGQMRDNVRPRNLRGLSTIRISGSQAETGIAANDLSSLSTDEFDLREEVMSCIAKSIGLLQPPASVTESVEASPAFLPADGRRAGSSQADSMLFGTSFGSLSLLDLNDDASSSITGGTSSAAFPDGTGMSGLDNEVEMLFFPAGATLTKAGETNTGLYYVIDGFLDILIPDPEASNNKGREGPAANKKKAQNEKPLFTVKAGGIAGYLASLCSNSSYVDIRAKTDTYVGFLPAKALERLMEKRPIVLLTLAKRLISLLSPLVLHVDASLEWMQVNAGQVLWRPGDESDSFYLVINGRLRVIEDKLDGTVSVIGEYGQGEAVGELDAITGTSRKTTVHAIRDTELIRLPQTLFNAVSARNPQTTAQILRTIAFRVKDQVDSSASNLTKSKKVASELGHTNNLKTIAILPVSRNVPVDVFARKLQSALEGIGAKTCYLNQASMSRHLGRHAFTRMGKLKAAGWLADLEQRYRTVLYVADSTVNSSWTQTCIRQADSVMVVGMGEDPAVGEYERMLLSMKTTARKELVLLHSDRNVTPGTTREWLKLRPWVHQHVHVELPGLVIPIVKPNLMNKDPDAVAALKNLKDKVQSGIQKYRGSRTDPRPARLPHTNDFSRLARRICGKSIGLVLGGGGARGIAHLGLLRALEEYNIPIDHIGGTSIGAFIGGLYAREGDILSSSGRAKQFSGRMGNIWRMLSDITYPIVAYTTGHEFNRALYKSFYDLHIEDMWLPFFCNSTNIMTSRMEVHETGYAWRYIRKFEPAIAGALSDLPDIGASMTLVGLFPPVCDNGHLLVDGGYLDNLPVSSMASLGTSAIFACDVGSIDDNSPRDFGDHVSGWWLLINRWNPFSNARNVPAITEIQSRLAYASSITSLEEAKNARNCMYLQMPVNEYGTTQFGKFEEIQEIGYNAAIAMLKKWDEEGALPSAYVDGPGEGNSGKKGRSARRNSI